MRDELVELLESARVEQQVYPFARGQLAGRTLALQAIVAAAQLGAAFELVQNLSAILSCRFQPSAGSYRR